MLSACRVRQIPCVTRNHALAFYPAAPRSLRVAPLGTAVNSFAADAVPLLVQVPCPHNASSECRLVAHGFCFGLPNGCYYEGMALAAIWASLVGSLGTRMGIYYDPVTMQVRQQYISTAPRCVHRDNVSRLPSLCANTAKPIRYSQAGGVPYLIWVSC